ncbi:hypothetical protein GGI35DRAFT_493694 [Trichoderma velutinum]
MQQLVPPGPPTNEERQLYYCGLPSRPKLVARSSTNIWVNAHRKEQLVFDSREDLNLKTLRPVGRHPLLHQLWNDASSSLRTQILQAVGVANWTAIDILRVCLNKEDPITLMVAVNPGSLSWSDGHAIAMRCKSILEAHHIYDVHCEIRESMVTFCTEEEPEADSTADSSADSTNETSSPTTFQLSRLIPENDRYANDWANFSDVLGTKIAMKHRDSLAGTKGLYLSLSPSSPGAGPKILALTCRQVVIDSKTEDLKTYCRPESAPFKDAIQVDQPNYKSLVGFLDWVVSGYRQRPDKHFDAIAPFSASSSRVFGQLFYSPEFTTTTTERGAQWLRDWALIELLPGSHQSPLTLIKNKVFIGTIDNFITLSCESKRRLKQTFPEDGCLTMESSVVPIDHIFKPGYTAEDEPTMVVKYGLSGKFTLGLGNTLKSVVRHTDTLGDVKWESEEWPIVSVVSDRDRQETFSTRGDSGACVWDMELRPAGMITAGSKFFEGAYDVTYGQPLERILADIKSCGYEVSLV